MRAVAWLAVFAWLACGAFGAGGRAIAADNAVAPQRLIVGVVPFLSTRLLHEVHRPLMDHLRDEFGAGTKMLSATSFRSFYAETVNGSYDIAVMPAHLARLAQVDHHFSPFLRYSTDVPGLVVATAGGGIAGAAQLAGKTIAVPDRLALTPIVVLADLEKQGLVAGRDFKLLEVPSFNSAVLAIERGDVQAAITTLPPLNQIPAAQRGKLNVVLETAGFPSLVYVAHPRLDPAVRARLVRSLLAFGALPAGKAFLEATQFGGFAVIGAEDMRRLDGYLAETRRQLASRPAS